MNTNLNLGTQSTTGKVHLATLKGEPRCGQRRTTRYRLAVHTGTVEQITCAACRRIATRNKTNA